MARLKMLGIAAMALAAIALASTATAAAAGGTTLCKANETPCSVGNHYAAGTEFVALSGPMTLTRTWSWKSEKAISCNQSRITGQTISTGSSTTNVEATIQLLELKECTLETAACMDYSLGMPWSGVIANTPGTMNGTLTLSNPRLIVRCPENGVTCEVSASSVALDFTGGEKATLTANETLKGAGGITCPVSVHWVATYTIEKPVPLYLAQAK
jgi:hypothetical protein